MTPQTQAYLHRINHKGVTDVTIETLTALQQAHQQTVPYENLDILDGIPLSLTPDALHDKIVNRYRGGFCFELNAAFGHLLHEMGYDVTNCFARYLLGETAIPMRRHHVLLVRLDGETWLCDVGVGNEAARRPLRLVESEIQTDGITSYRFEKDSYLGWILCQQHGDAFRRQFAFTEEPQIPADFYAASFFCEKHPDSIFNKTAMIAIKTPDGRKTIDGNVYKVFAHGEVTAETCTEAQISAILSEHFGL